MECNMCGGEWHRWGARLRPGAIPAGAFECEKCVLWDLKMGTTEGGDLGRAGAELLGAALAASTGKQYEGGVRGYVEWAKGRGIAEAVAKPKKGSMPLALLAAYMKERTKTWRPKTYDGLVAAVGDWHRARPGRTDPLGTPTGRLMVKGARRLAGARTKGKKKGGQAPAMRVKLLKKLLGWLERRGREDPLRRELYWRDAAWLVIGFTGLLRKGELAALQRRDVKVSKEGVTVHLRSSKTDQEGAGQRVYLGATTRTGIEIRDTVERWAKVGREKGRMETPFFTKFKHWRQGGTPKMTQEGLANKGEAMVSSMRRHIEGLEKARGKSYTEGLRYTGHSLRRGGASELERQGWRPTDIQAHGRWTSDCYKRYLEKTRGARRALSESM